MSEWFEGVKKLWKAHPFQQAFYWFLLIALVVGMPGLIKSVWQGSKTLPEVNTFKVFIEDSRQYLIDNKIKGAEDFSDEEVLRQKDAHIEKRLHAVEWAASEWVIQTDPLGLFKDGFMNRDDWWEKQEPGIVITGEAP